MPSKDCYNFFMPSVSIIIPTYNRADLICETLESIFAQTFCDYEIIVVDDGSDQDIPATITTAGHPINYQRIDHAGQGAARNIGMHLAQGQYVTFLDSDDLWAPPFLKKMTAALADNPLAGWVYCDYSTFDEQGELHPAYLPPAQKICGNLFAALLEGNFLCVGGLLFRRECFATVGGFDPELPPVEDWDLWLRVARQYDAVYVDEPLVRIRQNPTHASRNLAITAPLNLKVLAKLQREFPDEAQHFRTTIEREIRRYQQAHVAH